MKRAPDGSGSLKSLLLMFAEADVAASAMEAVMVVAASVAFAALQVTLP